MDAPLIVYQVAPWGDGVVLESIVVADHRAWAARVGFPVTLTQETAVRMMRRNACAILGYQARALRDGPTFLAPLKGEDVELLGGDSAATVSRILCEAVVRYEDESFDAKFLVSSSVFEAVPLSGIQARALCIAARALLGPEASDQKVADVLGRTGVPLARRTVNKYTNEERREVAPTARLGAKLESRIAPLRSEADLASLVATIVGHNGRQLAVLEDAGSPDQSRRAELRDWLVDSRVLAPEARKQFKSLDGNAQVRVVDAVLERLDVSVREAAARGAVRI